MVSLQRCDKGCDYIVTEVVMSLQRSDRGGVLLTGVTEDV